MKRAINIFLAFGCFRIEGGKQQNSDFQILKINRFLLIFFVEEYKKGEQLLFLSFFDNFDFQGR